MSAKDPPRIKWLIEPTFDAHGYQLTAGLDHLGREHGSPTPVRPPVGLSVNQGGDELHAIIRKMLQTERAQFQALVEAEQFESEEEANDFLCEDDLYPAGFEPWEDIFEFPEPQPSGAANGSQPGSGAVKGGSRGPEEPTPPAAASQTVSVGSSLPSSSAPKAETPIDAPVAGTGASSAAGR